MHLRALMAAKTGSFALSAAQLRCGYPPPASYTNGMGRQTFVFMRSVTMASAVAFHAFAAVPFLYELRQLLDWSCTPTTL
jgi:piezo-type mechanosensitive ion channel component 1/2